MRSKKTRGKVMVLMSVLTQRRTQRNKLKLRLNFRAHTKPSSSTPSYDVILFPLSFGILYG